MSCYVWEFSEIDQTLIAVVGGKAANLGELLRIDGVRVPPGFCVTTDAFDRILAEAPSINDELDQLSGLHTDDHDAIRDLGAQVRRTLEQPPIPDDLAAAITAALARTGESLPYAVRSSATAEDSPTASFAGQQDSYLNVVGRAQILKHVSRCWASLFTDRAIAYRQHNGLDHQKIRMAVVVQQMVFAGVVGSPLHGRPHHRQSQGRVRGGRIRARGSLGVRPGECRLLPGARRRDQRSRLIAPGTDAVDRLPSAAACAARPAHRSAFRAAAGHRMVPGRQRVCHRAEPTDHHALPHPGDQ